MSILILCELAIIASEGLPENFEKRCKQWRQRMQIELNCTGNLADIALWKVWWQGGCFWFDNRNNLNELTFIKWCFLKNMKKLDLFYLKNYIQYVSCQRNLQYNTSGNKNYFFEKRIALHTKQPFFITMLKKWIFGD